VEEGGREETPYKKDGVTCRTFQGLKKWFWHLLVRVLSLKRFTVEYFTVLMNFNGTEPKKYDRRYLIINFMSRRYLKQLFLLPIKVTKMSVSVFL